VYNIDARRDIIVPNARNAAALVSRTRLQDPVCRRTGGVGRAARAHGGVYIVRRPSAGVDQWQPAAGERSVRFSPVSGAFYYYFCFLIFIFYPPTCPLPPPLDDSGYRADHHRRVRVLTRAVHV